MIFLANFEFDLIQLLFNVFNNRLTQGGQLTELKNRAVETHARSVFLQGVLLGFNDLSSYFSTWKKQFKDYQIMVKESDFFLVRICTNFALSIQEIDKVLVGVNTERQLREIIKSVKEQGALNAHPIYDINLLNLSFWKL